MSSVQAMFRRMQPQPSREAWLLARRRGLGGSDGAAVLGGSKWNSPFGVWWSKRGPPEPEDDAPHLEWGRRAEAMILDKYREAEGVEYAALPEFPLLPHAEFPLIFATPDAVVVDATGGELLGGVDAKYLSSSRRADFGEEGTSAVPADYAIQGVHYMAVLGVPWWDFACLFGKWDYARFRVTRDEAREARYIARLLEWWERHVEAGVAPPADSSEGTERALRAMFSEGGLPKVEASAEADALRAEYHRGLALEAEGAGIKRGAANRLRQIIGNAGGIEGIASYSAGGEVEAVDYRAAYVDLERRLREETGDATLAERLSREALAGATTTKAKTRRLTVAKPKED